MEEVFVNLRKKSRKRNDQEDKEKRLAIGLTGTLMACAKVMELYNNRNVKHFNTSSHISTNNTASAKKTSSEGPQSMQGLFEKSLFDVNEKRRPDENGSCSCLRNYSFYFGCSDQDAFYGYPGVCSICLSVNSWCTEVVCSVVDPNQQIASCHQVGCCGRQVQSCWIMI